MIQDTISDVIYDLCKVASSAIQWPLEGKVLIKMQRYFYITLNYQNDAGTLCNSCDGCETK